MNISTLAGKPAKQEILVNVPRLITAYFTGKPDPSEREQRVAFGTSGHRGSSLTNSFNENHILAITQAICMYRKQHKIDGPLFLGLDTHALSAPAFATTMEVLVANEVEVMISIKDEYTPTPAISHAILKYNQGRKTGMADGIVITPSHNPPDDGGFKYNPPHGGPAGTEVTKWIEQKANELLKDNLINIKRIPLSKALRSSHVHRHDYLNTYINDLGSIIDMDVIRNSGIKMGVDPLGGAGVHYWEPIADRYHLDLTLVNKIVDPTFSFMSVDWDGQIRMDPSSSYAMHRLIAMKDQFDISFACDTDYDRHGIVTKSMGLMNPNQYLSVAIQYLLENRTGWNKTAAIGKTVVTTQYIDRIATKMKRKLYEVPVGFKWFVEGLIEGTLCFGGEESAGATFARINGKVWTTDKDGFIPALLSAEITAKSGRDPGTLYHELTQEFGESFYQRVEMKSTPEQQEKLKNIDILKVKRENLAGEKIEHIISNVSANNAPIGGIKVSTKNGWFAARPSGTEAIQKIYAESFLSGEHMHQIVDEAQHIINEALNVKE
ncbi:MAG: phosphoglucomutase (alpha-D-glucose-1,6-bisphosphate-dependent) [Cyclobacteriaceae bacterium]|jgi:phosphoglucomutase|nr:phosphoglucomutase (alpha-D-glucose-1,6-bisphosphate-dependent) [Cyclobacteriaceae bacterium]